MPALKSLYYAFTYLDIKKWGRGRNNDRDYFFLSKIMLAVMVNTMEQTIRTVRSVITEKSIRLLLFSIACFKATMPYVRGFN